MDDVSLAIGPDTRLSQVLDVAPQGGALDYVISLNPHDFERLRNPVLRRYMSNRISLRRVAAIAGISLDELLNGLARAGDFSIQSGATAAEEAGSPSDEPDWLRGLNLDQLHCVDILPIDAAHGDPFPPISLAVRQLEPGGVLVIRHGWEPQPLYDVWSKMGLEWFAHQVADHEWHIFVHRPASAPTFPIKPVVMSEVSHIPDEEVVPRTVAIAQQLRPGQSLDVSGLPHAHLAEVTELLGDGFRVAEQDGRVTRITRSDS